MKMPIQAPPIDRRARARVGARRWNQEEKRGVAAQDSCSVCTDILAGVIYGAANASCWAGCGVMSGAAAAACDAAFGGPEDPVGDAVCGTLDVALDQICDDQGCSSLENWSGAQSAAQTICKQANVC